MAYYTATSAVKPVDPTQYGTTLSEMIRLGTGHGITIARYRSGPRSAYYRAASAFAPDDGTQYPPTFIGLLKLVRAHGVTVTGHAGTAQGAPLSVQLWQDTATKQASGSIDAPQVTLGLTAKPFPLRSIYSQLQAFNGAQVLGRTVDDAYEVYDVRTHVSLGHIASMPRWLNDELFSLEPANGLVTLGLPARVAGSVGPVQKDPSSEQPSVNGLTAALTVSGDLIVFDKTAKLTARVRIPGGVNWVGMSPSGSHVLVQFNADGPAEGQGVWAYSNGSLGLAPTRQLVQTHHHGDQGTVGGRDVYWTIDNSPGNRSGENRDYPSLIYIDVATGERHYVRTMAWGAFEHICARGPDGWALVSGDTLRANRPLSGELWAVRHNGVTVRICVHGAAGTDYWVRPMATWSITGRYVLFGNSAGGQLVELP